jgi:hypothetical protein
MLKELQGQQRWHPGYTESLQAMGIEMCERGMMGKRTAAWMAE